MSAKADSAKVVIAALLGNALIAISKFIAAFITGSAATLAEAVHSVADTTNQALLLLGLRLSKHAPTARHPFGRATEQYFWAFVVAIMLFSVGGVFAIYEGIHKLVEIETAVALATGEHPSSFWNYVVLGTSFVFESYSCTVAWIEFRKMKGKTGTYAALTEARDPTIPVVLMEDFAALLGLAVALLGVLLTDLTGWGGYDGIASVVIGVILCFVAVFLSRETHSLLLGESAPEEVRRRVEILSQAVLGVRRVKQVLSMHRGPEHVVLALKIEFDPALSLAEVEKAIDAIEEAIRKELPQMRHIFVEPDSQYSAEHDPEGAHKAPLGQTPA